MTEEMQVTEDKALNTESLITIGRTLVAAREERNLSRAEIAKALHLPQRIIDDLESNQFSNHPGAIFMRGYLRLYARYLCLPTDVLMKEFDELNLQAPAQTMNLKPRVYKHQKNISPHLIRLITFFIFMVILAMVVIWWRGHHMDEFFSKHLLQKQPQDATLAINDKLLKNSDSYSADELMQLPAHETLAENHSAKPRKLHYAGDPRRHLF